MHVLTLTTVSILVATSFLVALITLWILSFFTGRKSGALLSVSPVDLGIVFLFEGDDLIDATPAARKLLENAPDCANEWYRFLAAFLPLFPELKTTVEGLSGEGARELLPDDRLDATRMNLRWWGGLLRISINDRASAENSGPIDHVSLKALENELHILRRTVELSPFPVWQVDRKGQIIWANAAYLKLVETLSPDDEIIRTWPPRQLFPPIVTIHQADGERSRRVSINLPGPKDERIWFDCFSKPLEDGMMHFAIEADAIVKAETSLRNFIQTLSLTFAHLPIGLAIFDRARQLTLFNPALTDLLLLPADFLSTRPTLNAFLNRLREIRMIPEPKDYKNWCQQMEDLETKAKNGTYQEIWTLPGGQTYRIVGRPHPNGAVAFLFEDISAEISLTRRFRSQIEIGQAVVNSFKEAVAVFSPTGVLTFSNTAYADLWGVDPGTTFGEMILTDAIQNWTGLCGPDKAWETARQMVGQSNDRVAKEIPVQMKSGQRLNCRLVPLPGGATMIGFSEIGQEKPLRLEPHDRRPYPVKA